MKSPLRESCPEMLLHVVKEERALGENRAQLCRDRSGILEGLRDRTPAA